MTSLRMAKKKVAMMMSLMKLRLLLDSAAEMSSSAFGSEKESRRESVGAHFGSFQVRDLATRLRYVLVQQRTFGMDQKSRTSRWGTTTKARMSSKLRKRNIFTNGFWFVAFFTKL